MKKRLLFIAVFCFFPLAIVSAQELPEFDYFLYFEIDSMNCKIIRDSYVKEHYTVLDQSLSLGVVKSGDTIDRFWGLLQDSYGNVKWNLIGNIIWNYRPTEQLAGAKAYTQGGSIDASEDLTNVSSNYIDGTISCNKKGCSIKIKAGQNWTYAPQDGYWYSAIAICSSISGKEYIILMQ